MSEMTTSSGDDDEHGDDVMLYDDSTVFSFIHALQTLHLEKVLEKK